MNDNQVMAVMIVVAMLLIVVIAVVKIRAQNEAFSQFCGSVPDSGTGSQCPERGTAAGRAAQVPWRYDQYLFAADSADFPEFNWEELRTEVERSVKDCWKQKMCGPLGWSAFIKR